MMLAKKMSMPSDKLQDVYFSFVIDKNLRIKSFSKELELLCGELLPKIKGTPYYKIIPAIDKNSITHVKKVFKNGKPAKFGDCQCISFYGLTDADIMIEPLIDRKGNIHSATITAKTKLNIDILNRLKQSKRLLDIGKIAATLAHGVRSPLNAIRGSVVYLKEKYAKERELIEFTNIIEDEILRLDNFVSNFLSTSSLEDNPHELDINQILHKVEILIAHQTKSSNIKSSFKYGKVPPVIMNPFYLEHAVLNVINNAIEAMPSGGQIRVTSCSKKFTGKRFSIIKVVDSGNGTHNKFSPKMPILRKRKGKGMGLFITHEILRSVDGYLEMKNEQGKGTQVGLYIPAK